MTITTSELNERIAEIRSLKALRKETENAIKALELDVIGFMAGLDESEYIGTDYEITYKPQSRTSLDKKRLEADLGCLKDYEKVTTFKVLLVK